MLSEKPWRFEAVIRLWFLWFISVTVGALLGDALWQWEAIRVLGSRSFFSIVMGAISMHGAAFVLVQWFLREHGFGWRDAFGLRVPKWGWIAFGAVGLTLLMIPVVHLIAEGISRIMVEVGLEPQAQETVKALRTNAGMGQRIFFGVVAIGIAPVTEEILFRGILYPGIKRLGYPHLALWGTAFFFGVIHANVVTVLPLTALAVVWTLLYENSDNLLVPIVAHSVFNAANFFSVINWSA